MIIKKMFRAYLYYQTAEHFNIKICVGLFDTKEEAIQEVNSLENHSRLFLENNRLFYKSKKINKRELFDKDIQVLVVKENQIKNINIPIKDFKYNRIRSFGSLAYEIKECEFMLCSRC